MLQGVHKKRSAEQKTQADLEVHADQEIVIVQLWSKISFYTENVQNLAVCVQTGSYYE